VRADVAGAAGDEHGASFHGSHVVLLGDDGRSGVGWDGAGGRRRDRGSVLETSAGGSA
jgi:hypothetical protein